MIGLKKGENDLSGERVRTFFWKELLLRHIWQKHDYVAVNLVWKFKHGKKGENVS